MIEQQLYHSRLFKLIGKADVVAGGFLSVPNRKEPIDDRLTARLESWFPHLERALRLETKLKRSERIQKTLLGALDHLNEGVIVVDRDMKILSTNVHADQMLERAEGVASRLGKLLISGRKGLMDFDALVGKMIVRRGESVEYDTILIERETGLPPIRITVLPADGVGTATGLARSFAILLVSDPVLSASITDEIELMRRFGLSAAEARAVKLVPFGYTKSEIADQLGRSENTVKTQIASAIRKTGARNIVELAAILGANGFLAPR